MNCRRRECTSLVSLTTPQPKSNALSYILGKHRRLALLLTWPISCAPVSKNSSRSQCLKRFDGSERIAHKGSTVAKSSQSCWCEWAFIDEELNRGVPA